MQPKDLLLPWRSVLDNAALGLALHGIPRRQPRRQALELTPLFGLKGFEHQDPLALSGGLRQRAAFPRTMMLDQGVVLLDEPFGWQKEARWLDFVQWIQGNGLLASPGNTRAAFDNRFVANAR